MLTATLVLLGAALVVLAIADQAVRRLPLTPAVIYLGLGWLAGRLLGGPGSTALIIEYAQALKIGTEFALLASLFAIGLRLRFQSTARAWRVALWLAGPAMLITIALTTLVGTWLLGLPWPAVLLLAAVLAPTDPVLASEVQTRSDADRDAVRMSLSAEGGLNDGTAMPVVALAFALIGLRDGEAAGAGWPGALRAWWWTDLVWPLAGGVALGIALGWLLGRLLRWRLAAGDPVARDELVFVGSVALAFGLAHVLHLSTFLMAFATGCALLQPLRDAAPHHGEGPPLAERMDHFGGRFERLVEAAMVLTVGGLLGGLPLYWDELAFALVLFAMRPLAVLAVVRTSHMPARQRRLVAWFGIRGVGSLYYLLLALELGTHGTFAEQLVRVTLGCVALSIVLHGISATPLMAAHQRRRSGRDDAIP